MRFLLFVLILGSRALLWLLIIDFFFCSITSIKLCIVSKAVLWTSDFKECRFNLFLAEDQSVTELFINFSIFDELIPIRLPNKTQRMQNAPSSSFEYASQL